jgi:hypothetical protein
VPSAWFPDPPLKVVLWIHYSRHGSMIHP